MNSFTSLKYSLSACMIAGLVAPGVYIGPAVAAEKCDGCWASVLADGSLLRGKSVASSDEIFTGGYEVIFTKRVDGCGFQATVGTSDTNEPKPAQILVAKRIETNFGVYVQIDDSAGKKPAARPFIVFVHC